MCLCQSFYRLRRLRGIRKLLNRDVLTHLVSVFVLSRLDYCNAMLVDLPSSALAPLQRVLNAAARLILNLGPRDHLTLALLQLHWLPIRQRIEFKVCLLVHLAITGHSPAYLTELITPVSELSRGVTLRSVDRGDLHVPRTRLRTGYRAFSVAGPR